MAALNCILIFLGQSYVCEILNIYKKFCIDKTEKDKSLQLQLSERFMTK